MMNDMRKARMLRERRIANGNEIRSMKFDHEQEVFVVVVDVGGTPEVSVKRGTVCASNAINLRYFICIRGVSRTDQYAWVEEAQLYETREAAEAEMETPE